MPVEELHEGIRIQGIQIEGIIDLPMPCPGYAIVDDLLIVSPVLSAVKEGISAIHGTDAKLMENPFIVPDTKGAKTVELVHLNLKEWEREWRRSGPPSLTIEPTSTNRDGSRSDGERVPRGV